MSPEPVTAEHVYSRLKALITSGSLAAGQTVVATELAVDLGVSTSPVRDALHRLRGERLLIAHTGGGFEIPHLSVNELHDLYVWHGRLIRMALKDRKIPNGKNPMVPDGWPVDYSSPGAIVDTTARMFGAMAHRASSHELKIAAASAGERLRTVRLREVDRWNDAEQELEAVRLLAISGTRNELLNALWIYHRRRIRNVEKLIAWATRK